MLSFSNYRLLLVLVVLLQNTIEAQRGSFITIEGHDNQTYKVFAAGDEDAESAVIFVHDYFGLSATSKHYVEKLASFGHRVIGVDLYHGSVATSNDAAVALMKAKAKNEKQTQNILQAALDYLKRPGRKIASVGFSAGAVDAMKVNLLEPDLFSASVFVYGGDYDLIEKGKLSTLSSPILAITGALDKWPMDAAQNFLNQQKDKPLNLFVIAGADHGYAQPLFNEGKNYDYEATRMTWLLMEDFLNKNLH